MLVTDVITAYLEAKALDVAAALIGPRALEKARFYLGRFVAHFGQLHLEDCKRGDLKRFLGLHPEYRSPHTKLDAVARIVACFRWAEDERLIPHCPYKRPRDLPAPQPRQPITAAEVRAIMAQAKSGYPSTAVRFRLALWFLWETGCRTCELYKLDWSQYDDVRGVFTLDGKTTAKTGQQRMVVLPARAWRLVRWLRRKCGIGLVFRNGRCRAWNKGTFAKLFRKHARAAGVREEVSAYCLRHGFTCAALEAGVGERQLADYLGHTTTRYIGWYGRGVKSRVDYLRRAGEMGK